MSIRLSVVGIFFGKDLPNLKKDTSVKGVLAEAKRAALNGELKTGVDLGRGQSADVTGFDYKIVPGFEPNTEVAQSFTAHYGLRIRGREVKYNYNAGEYFLEENVKRKPDYSVWQYYVLNAEGKSVTNGQVRFLNDPQAIVPVGGTLIWRLVSILTGPNAPPAVSIAGRAIL